MEEEVFAVAETVVIVDGVTVTGEAPGERVLKNSERSSSKRDRLKLGDDKGMSLEKSAFCTAC
ncbi:MAG: hypothetical protein K8L99_10855 [Anaerolineae bacterium]|nr:hypothetical protein [Anaerolineae bacterium]